MNAAKKLFLSQRTLVTLFSSANKLQMQGDKDLQDITLRQMLTVAAIIHAPEGEASINYVAHQLGTSKQNAKQLVKALEKKGYLSVLPSRTDKRAVNITLTPTGEKAFRACSDRNDTFLRNVFGKFTIKELETFVRLLEKLYGFDGISADGFSGHMEYNRKDMEEMLHHHPSFLTDDSHER